MLTVRGLSVEVGIRLTLANASFTVAPGDKVGLVGRNGAGKTSLLKVLAGDDPPYEGTVHVTGRMGFLIQDPRAMLAGGANADRTALEHVLSGRGLADAAVRLEKLRLAMEEDASDAAVSRYTRAEERFGADGGYAAESEVRRLLAGLGLGADRVDLPIGVLSGGERRRVELSRILFAGSEALMLDEPTNHLDADAKVWLTGFLRNYRGALLVVSHDIELLDDAITRVLHLEDAELTEYKGTYSQYRTQRAKDAERLAKVAARQSAEINRLSTLADSMRGSTVKRARIAHSLDTRVAKLETQRVTGLKKEHTLKLRLPEPPSSGRTSLEATNLSKSYAGPPVFTDVSFGLERGERLLIMGFNGAGKTSLLRILAGQSQPDTGMWSFGHNVSAGYYAQEHEGIQEGHDLMWHIRSQADLPDLEMRSLLGMFGLRGDQAFQDASTLSGGEKTKLSLAQLVAGRHNLLLLDEPTNNLDPPSRTAVATALAGWPGSIVLVSHDPEFVEALAPQRVLLMPDGTLDYWSDDLLDLVALS